MKKLFAYCFSVAAVVVIAKAQAFSCSCVDMGDSVKSKVANWSKASAAVFSGKVLKREEVEGTIDVIYTFSVDEVWKGSLDSSIEVTITQSSCGFDFKSGTAYLIYAFNNSGILRPGACMGVTDRGSDWGKQQAGFLGKGKPPKKVISAKDGSN